MYICNLKHLFTLPEGTIFAKYREDDDGFQVGGLNKLIKVNGNEVECFPITSQYHDSKMDSSFGCYLRTKRTVKEEDTSGEEYPAVTSGYDNIVCSDDDYMFAIYSAEDIVNIITELQTPCQ